MKPIHPTSLESVFGHKPTFSDPLHVGEPNILSPEMFFRLCGEAFNRRRLTNHGPIVEELESRVSSLLNVEHVIAVTNATLGMQIVLRALDLSGQIIMPAFSFVATAHAAKWEGLDPYFVDVDPITHNIQPEGVRIAHSKHTKAIVGVHLWGNPCATSELEAIGKEGGMPVVFDAAHAFLSGDEFGNVGGRGSAEVFSLHATKFFNSAEGGLITTRDGNLASRIRRMINFGFSGYDKIGELGTNAKMSELSAALALSNLSDISGCLDANRRNYMQYKIALSEIAGINVLNHNENSNYQYIVVEVDDCFPLSRDQLCALLWHENVRARRYFTPGNHRCAPYSCTNWDLPVTDRLCNSLVQLPTGPRIHVDYIEKISNIIKRGISSAPAVRTFFDRFGFPWNS